MGEPLRCDDCGGPLLYDETKRPVDARCPKCEEDKE